MRGRSLNTEKLPLRNRLHMSSAPCISIRLVALILGKYGNSLCKPSYGVPLQNTTAQIITFGWMEPFDLLKINELLSGILADQSADEMTPDHEKTKGFFVLLLRVGRCSESSIQPITLVVASLVWLIRNLIRGPHRTKKMYCEIQIRAAYIFYASTSQQCKYDITPRLHNGTN